MSNFTPVRFHIDGLKKGDQVIYNPNEGFQITGGCCNCIFFKKSKKVERTLDKLNELIKADILPKLADHAQLASEVKLDEIKQEKRLLTLDECQELVNAMNLKIADCHKIFEYLKLQHFFLEDSSPNQVGLFHEEEKKNSSIEKQSIIYVSCFDLECELTESLVLKQIEEIPLTSKLDDNFKFQLAKQILFDIKNLGVKHLLPINIKEQAVKYLKKDYSLLVVESYLNQDLIEAVRFCNSPDDLNTKNKNLLMEIATI